MKQRCKNLNQKDVISCNQTGLIVLFYIFEALMFAACHHVMEAFPILNLALF